jgi:hypothetical protein
MSQMVISNTDEYPVSIANDVAIRDYRMIPEYPLPTQPSKPDLDPTLNLKPNPFQLI